MTTLTRKSVSTTKPMSKKLSTKTAVTGKRAARIMAGLNDAVEYIQNLQGVKPSRSVSIKRKTSHS